MPPVAQQHLLLHLPRHELRWEQRARRRPELRRGLLVLQGLQQWQGLLEVRVTSGAQIGRGRWLVRSEALLLYGC